MVGPDGNGEREEAHSGQRNLLPALERVNRIMLAAPSLEAMLADVLDEMLCVLDCDRAWLLYPCSTSADWFSVPMERTRPEWPGAGTTSERLPMAPFARQAFQAVLESEGARCWDEHHGRGPLDTTLNQHFSVKAMMAMAVHPRLGAPWMLGIHHCRDAHVFGQRDCRLLEAIGSRLADGLTSMLSHRASLDDRRRLEHAQELARLGSYEWTRDGETFWSRELYRLFGIEPGTHPRRLETVLEHVHPDDRASVETQVTEVMQNGGSYEFQARATRPDGEEWIMQARGEAVLGDGGCLQGMSGIAQDVTERVRAEEHRLRLESQLRQSQKMQSLGQLTGGVAHDFNNLLTVILGNLAEIPEALRDDPDEVLSLVAGVNAAARRAADLTRMLTAFSRRQPLKPRIVDVNSLLAGFESLLRRTLGENIAIEVIGAAGLWRCEVDPAQLENALLNLALNARDAMPDGGKLTIESGNARVDRDYARKHDEVEPGQYVLIAVTDNGVGMSEDTLTRVFEPFFTTKGPGRGTGLGLSMVYGFVKQSGGHVKLYSEPGEGTTARIYLPRTHEPKSEAPPPRGSETPGSGELILIVEDESDVRSLTTRMVERLGYRAVVAEDAARALEELASHPDVALLFTDVVLPGTMNGAQLARRAQRMRPGLPVLFTSGYTENAVIHHGRLDPGVELLEKPFSRSELSRCLSEALAAKKRT